MANKKLVAVSYCFIFLSIYFVSIAYAFLSESLNKTYDISMPQTTAMNATTSALSSFSSWGGTIVTAGIMALVLAIIFMVIGRNSMSSAMA